MTKHLNTALLAVIAGALALPQLPAAHKFIHNNVVYPVQMAWVERARGISKMRSRTTAHPTQASGNRGTRQTKQSKSATGPTKDPDLSVMTSLLVSAVPSSTSTRHWNGVRCPLVGALLIDPPQPASKHSPITEQTKL